MSMPQNTHCVLKRACVNRLTCILWEGLVSHRDDNAMHITQVLPSEYFGLTCDTNSRSGTRRVMDITHWDAIAPIT